MTIGYYQLYDKNHQLLSVIRKKPSAIIMIQESKCSSEKKVVMIASRCRQAIKIQYMTIDTNGQVGELATFRNLDKVLISNLFNSAQIPSAKF